MTDISVKNIKKAYEQGENVLDGLSFEIHTGEHVGILGKNGCGKTTLFKILSGEIHEDGGELSIASGKRLGLISQIPKYPEHYTTEDVLKTAHERVYAIGRRMEALSAEMERGSDDAILREYDRLSADFEPWAAMMWTSSETAWPTAWTSPPPCERDCFPSSPAGKRPAST